MADQLPEQERGGPDRARPAPVPDGSLRYVAPPLLAAVAIVLLSVNLRPGASSVGPVLEELRSSLGMGGTVAGLMTAIPGLCFGAVGLLAVELARRIGVTTGIFLSVVAIAGGLLGRVLTDSVPVFLAMTALALAGMAVCNVLTPAWIKRHSSDGGVVLMTIYGAGLTLGGALGSLLAAPVAAAYASTWGWRAALGVWGVVALLALLPWVPILGGERRARRGRRPLPRVRQAHISTSPTALALTLLFGIQAMNAYVQFGWLPQIYRDAGLSAVHAGALIALLTTLGILGGLLMPTVIARSRTLAPWMLTMGALCVAGYAGLLLAPATLPWLWAVLLGLAGFAFPTTIALLTARTRDPQVTARLSGFVQPVGYVLAAIGPMVVGMIYGATGGWTLVLILLMVSGVALGLAGLRVAKPVYVDDELAA